MEPAKRRGRRSRFIRIVVTITILVHAPFVVAVSEALRRVGVANVASWIVGFACGALGLALFAGRARLAMNDAPRPYWRTALFDLPYYIHWSACIFCLFPSLAYVIFEPLVDLARGTPVGPRPGFFMWLYVTGLVVSAYGVTIRRWWFVVRKIDVPIRGLDPKLDGYTIAQLSDLHIGAQTPAWWGRRWVRAANARTPDLVVVTGDMVTNGVAFHADIANLVGDLRGKDGTYVIMGNHDYFGEGEPLVSLLRERGVHVLRNEGIVLEKNGAKMYLAGIDDTWTRRANLDRALESRPADIPAILLAHDPATFPAAAKQHVDLVLSGHTHGGQIAMPFLSRLINASKLAHRYHIGVYEEGDSTLYVHPGLGTTGPPIRVGVAPVVAMITLRAA